MFILPTSQQFTPKQLLSNFSYIRGHMLITGLVVRRAHRGQYLPTTRGNQRKRNLHPTSAHTLLSIRKAIIKIYTFCLNN